LAQTTTLRFCSRPRGSLDQPLLGRVDIGKRFGKRRAVPITEPALEEPTPSQLPVAGLGQAHDHCDETAIGKQKTPVFVGAAGGYSNMLSAYDWTHPDARPSLEPH